jgi:LPS-assembly protein
VATKLSRLTSAPSGPTNISGQTFYYDKHTDTFIARGDARLSRGTTLLTADTLQFNRRENKSIATGNVHLVTPMIDVTASKATLDTNLETGILENGKVSVQGGNYYLAGREIEKLVGQHYSIRDGYFTTCGCEPGTPSWSISGSNLNVQMGGKAEVKDAHFDILDCPVTYLPYATFPANTDRESGFLSPRFGQSRLRGLQFFEPYYYDINKSSDATAALDVETSARIGALAEYRIQNGEDDYLKVTGAFFDESIRSQESRVNDVIDTQIADPHIPVDRYGFIGLLRQHITPNLVAYGDGITVSDSLYLREMNIYTLSRGYGSSFQVMRTADSHFGLIQSFEDSFVRLQGTWIQDLIQPQNLVMQTLPELLWSGRQQWMGGLAYSDYDFMADDFWRQDGVGGQRLDLSPHLNVPWRWGDYLYGLFNFGARETFYDDSGHTIGVIPAGSPGHTNNNGLFLDGLTQGGFQTREMLYGEARVSSILEKIYQVHWGTMEALKNTIEPVVDYNYIPVVHQTQLPLFDNVDRIEPRSLITYGFVSRIFAKFEGSASESSSTEAANSTDDLLSEVLPVETYNQGSSIRELLRLSLMQSFDTLHAVTPSGSRLSDAEASVAMFPTSVATLGSTMDYNPRDQKIGYANVFVAMRPFWETMSPTNSGRGRALTGGPFIQVNYSFIGGNQGLHQFSARAYWEFFDRLGLYYQPSYDIADGRMLSSEYGLRLKSKCDCWNFDVGIIDSFNPSETQVQVMLTLGGIGSVGHNPFGRNPFQRNAVAGNIDPY